jgi:lipopolysaccharide biosynthesis glycosyltransferase
VDIDMILLVADTYKRVSPEHMNGLRDSGWQICNVSAIESPGTPVDNRYHAAKMFSKLRVWQLDEYQGVLYTDADVVTFSDPASVFRDLIPYMRSTDSGLGMLRRNSHWASHNAGVMVLIPSKTIFQRMLIHTLNTSYNSFYAEQDFLNVYWRNNIMRLPYKYNVFADAESFEHIKKTNTTLKPMFLHFIAKPWRSWKLRWQDNTESMTQFWYHIPPAYAFCPAI